MASDRDEPTLTRSLGVAVLVGAGIGLLTLAVAFAIIAIPFFALARTEPGHGLDRPFVRDGLFRVAIPVGCLVGVVTAGLVGRWYRRGGHLPTDRGPDIWR